MAKRFPHTPRWSKNQQIFGWIGFVLGVGMFIIIGLGWEPFGKPTDFGFLPLALVAMGIYVVVGINIIALLRGDVEEDKDYPNE